jgi:protein phosphatase
VLVVLAVLIAGSYVGVRVYVGRQWYVGVAGGKVAVFNGVPVSVAGVHLSHVDTATDLPAAQAEALPLWHGLSDGISARNRADALAIVAQVQADLCSTSTIGCTSPSGTGPAPTPTPTASTSAAAPTATGATP